MATIIGDGRKTVTTAGTAVALAATEPTAGAIRSLVVTALSTNTGVICVGGTTVLAAAGTRRGTPLAASGSVSLDFSGGLTQIFIDSTVNGEGVSYTYVI